MKEEKPKCLLVVRSGKIQQETYETMSRFAAGRARQLRRLGYPVTVSQMGRQVTPWGLVRCSLLTIYGVDDNVPEVKSY